MKYHWLPCNKLAQDAREEFETFFEPFFFEFDFLKYSSYFERCALRVPNIVIMAANGSTATSGRLSFREIGFQGGTIGSVNMKDDRIEWRDTSGKNVKEFIKGDFTALSWTLFGQKGFLKISLKEGKTAKLDGFQKMDFEPIAEFCQKFYEMELEKEKVG